MRLPQPLVTIGIVLTAALFVVSLVLMSASSVNTESISSGSEVRMASLHEAHENFVTPQQFQETLIRLGLDADSLSAAGVTTAEVSTILGNCLEFLEPLHVGLSTMDADCAEGAALVDQLERLARAGLAEEETLSALVSARETFATALTARATLLDELFTDAIGSLSELQRARLTVVRSNRIWQLPSEYLVTQRSEVDWIALRSALAHEKYATSSNQPIHPNVQTLLEEVRSDTAVAAAITNLTLNGAAIAAAWQQGVIDPQ